MCDSVFSGGIPALVELLKIDNEDIQSVAVSVLFNISEHDPVRRALTEANAGPILIQLLTSPVDEIQSRAATVLSDLACVDGNQSGKNHTTLNMSTCVSRYLLLTVCPYLTLIVR